MSDLPTRRLAVDDEVSVDRERIVRKLTFWLRPAFVLRVLNRFQLIAGLDRAMAPTTRQTDGPTR